MTTAALGALFQQHSFLSQRFETDLGVFQQSQFKKSCMEPDKQLRSMQGYRQQDSKMFILIRYKKSILMQLANEQSTNDTVSSSSSTQQQRFGLRKGHPYNLSQTPIQVWLNRPCVIRNERNEWPCRPTANASGTHLPKQPSKFLSTQVVFLIQLRYISSLLATLVLSMLRQTFLSKKPQTHFFIADWLVISYLCFNSQKKLG